MFEFLKTKLFNSVTAFISPFILLIAVFLIWNSDLIMSKFGYDTRSNLKEQTTNLQNQVSLLKEENMNLNQHLNDTIETIGIVDKVTESYNVSKTNSDSKVEELIEKRNTTRNREVTVEEIPTTATINYNKESYLNTSTSKANITIINEAYNSFFMENK